MEKQKYDALVIGAGNGGLIAALRLAKSGKKVLLAERHILPGGFATGFKRGRFYFEASLHELCDLGHEDKHGNLYTLFNELGVYDKLHFVDVPEAFRVINSKTKETYEMPFGIDNFINKMEEYVPGSRKSVTTFFELGAEIRKATRYLNESHGKPDSKVLREKFPNFMRVAVYSVDKVLKAIKMPKKAQEIINTYWSYLGTPTDELGFIHYCIMVYLYVSLKAQVPVERSHEISSIIAKEIEDNGGEIYFGDGVKEILVDKDGVKGAILDSGKEIETKHIISNASPDMVYESLIKDKSLIPEEQLKLSSFRKLSGRGLSIFLGLNKSKDELGLNSYSYFIYDSLNSREAYNHMLDLDNHSQVTVVLNNALPDCSPKGTTILYMTSLYFSEVFDKAINESNYFDLKDEIANKFIDNFEKSTGVKIKDSIEEIEVATPLTYAHYTSTPDGSIYGYYTANLDNMMARLNTMYDEVILKGLRFAGGHAMRSSGYNSSYLSGDLVAKLTLADMKEDR